MCGPGAARADFGRGLGQRGAGRGVHVTVIVVVVLVVVVGCVVVIYELLAPILLVDRQERRVEQRLALRKAHQVDRRDDLADVAHQYPLQLLALLPPPSTLSTHPAPPPVHTLHLPQYTPCTPLSTHPAPPSEHTLGHVLSTNPVTVQTLSHEYKRFRAVQDPTSYK
eukprot:3056070-Rhodomonas_salina.1